MKDGVTAIVSTFFAFVAVLKIYPGEKLQTKSKIQKSKLGEVLCQNFLLEHSLCVKIAVDDLFCLFTECLADYIMVCLKVSQ